MTIKIENTCFTDEEISSIMSLKSKAFEVARTFLFNFQTLCEDYKLNTHHIIIAGGCFSSWYHGEKPKDVDIFFLENSGNEICMMKYISSSEIDVNIFKSYRSNDNIIKVVDEKDVFSSIFYQYIFTKYQDRKSLINHFDFIHAAVSYNIGEQKLYVTPKAFRAIKNRLLIKQDTAHKVEDWRISKYERKGWTLT